VNNPQKRGTSLFAVGEGRPRDYGILAPDSI
jgi:hypothetical protein